MNAEFADKSIAQGHGRAEHDQNSVKGDSYVLRKVANGPTDPNHIKTDNADRKSGQYVYTPIPAMKGRRAVPDLRNKLNRSADDYNDGQEKMYSGGDIAYGIARDISMRHAFIPRLPIPLHSRTTKESYNI